MEDPNIFTITAAIADPVRLSVMMYLMTGAASVTEMITHLEVSQSNLSNHLAVLKNAGLIKANAHGRQKIYEIASPGAAQLIELLLNLQPMTPKKEQIIKPIQMARTCYDHLAGKLGVAVFEALMQLGAIRYQDDADSKERQLLCRALIPGPNAEVVFCKLGVGLSSLKNARRKFAFGCMDWTERAPHLAGALGAALCHAFFDKNWIVRKNESRTIALTTTGKQALRELIGLDADLTK